MLHPLIRLFVGRTLFKTKRDLFLSLLGGIAFFGIFISVASFILIHSVMSGFSSAIHQEVGGLGAPLEIQLPENQEDVFKIEEVLTKNRLVSDFIEVAHADAILLTDTEETFAVQLTGVKKISPTFKDRLSIFQEDQLRPLTDLSLTVLPRGDVYLDNDLLSHIALSPDLDQHFTLMLPLGDVAPSGELIPVRKSFRLAGTIKTSENAEGVGVGVLSLEDLLQLSPAFLPRLFLEVSLKDIEQGSLLKKQLLSQFPELSIKTSEESNKRLFAALKLEQSGMFLFLIFVTFMASANLFGVVSLLLTQKSRELALFYTFGAPTSLIQKIFSMTGFMIGLISTLLGVSVAGILLFYFSYHPLPLPSAYYISDLPIKINPVMILFVVVLAPLLCTLAATWPVLRFKNWDPISILKDTRH